MVDEYQDVSEIQDRLFRAVSRDGRNLLLVGDGKQSIYRFRLAEPGLFIDKLLRYGDADAPAGEPRRVLLRENFRSRGCVIDAVNHVFENLMSPRMGEIRYDDGARLRQGADYPAEGDTPAEFSILELPGSSDADEECPNKTELEAAMVARRIRELLDSGTLVSDSGALRPLSCGDIVILLRAPGGAGDVYRRALLREGLPAVSRQGGGFFQSLEVAVLLSLLGIIDNPRQDVPLISVLSPLRFFRRRALRDPRRRPEIGLLQCAYQSVGK
jgi:ATP-dependent helicase/nuclease subunit A